MHGGRFHPGMLILFELSLPGQIESLKVRIVTFAGAIGDPVELAVSRMITESPGQQGGAMARGRQTGRVNISFACANLNLAAAKVTRRI